MTSRLLGALREGIVGFGVARWIIVAFLGVIWIVAATATDENLGKLLGDCLVRSGMNGVLVLALLLPVRAGNGLNFGLPLGIVCGLVGGVVGMEFVAASPFGMFSTHEALARGWSGFFFAHLVALPLAAVCGLLFGWLLERVRGQEMMVGIYVGFGAIAFMCVVWLLIPVRSPELVLPIGGKGVRQTVLIDDYYTRILDHWPRSTEEGAGGIENALHALFDFGTQEPAARGDGDRDAAAVVARSWVPHRNYTGFFVPVGLLIYWALACTLMGLFLRTRLGVAMSTAGANPQYARSIGISVPRMRIGATAISTVLGAAGILVYSQSYGFYQLYKAPLWMAFQIVAALLLGGASLRKATVFHVVLGTLLFQSLLTTSLPVVNDLVEGSEYASSLSNLPEIARLMIQNGVILYALTRVTGGRR
ncbi:MAG: ABC transporter permease [Planctomycetes bacterium]|nr:ABC transporter permease [Planctomycetota bacterium]